MYSLEEILSVDPQVGKAIQQEIERQRNKLNLLLLKTLYQKQ